MLRVFSRMRWWWTAEVSSSDGIGREVAVGVPVGEDDEPRARSSIASETSAQMASRRARSAGSPPLTS